MTEPLMFAQAARKILIEIKDEISRTGRGDYTPAPKNSGAGLSRQTQKTIADLRQDARFLKAFAREELSRMAEGLPFQQKYTAAVEAKVILDGKQDDLLRRITFAPQVTALLKDQLQTFRNDRAAREVETKKETLRQYQDGKVKAAQAYERERFKDDVKELRSGALAQEYKRNEVRSNFDRRFNKKATKSNGAIISLLPLRKYGK